MSSLWTPEGEHRIAREGGTAAAARASHAPSGSQGPPAGRDEEQLRAEMAELERQLAGAPVEDVIANHCYGIFQLAALYLSQSPPRLDAARLAIDALAAVVEALGDRLGASAGSLRDGLTQLRLAFVQIAGAQRTGDSQSAAATGAEHAAEPAGPDGSAPA